MANLHITSISPYTRLLNKITVTGTADAGVTVRVIIIPQPPQTPIATPADFNVQYNNTGLTTKASKLVEVVGMPLGQPTWSVDVPVTGLTAGTGYDLYASDGVGKVVGQPVTFN